MAEHHAFGLARSPTCVNQHCAVAWFLPLHGALQDLVRDFRSHGEELTPGEDSRLVQVLRWYLLEAPRHDSLYIWQVRQEAVPQFELLQGIAYDHLGVRVSGLVPARVRPVRDVHTTHDVIVEYRTIERYRPLRRVEAHDIDCLPLRDPKLLQALRKSTTQVPILIPSPGVLDKTRS